MLKGKKAIIVAAVLGFMAGNMVSVPKADAGSVLGNIGKAVKTGGIVWLVDRTEHLYQQADSKIPCF